MDLLSTDPVSPVKVNQLFDYYKNLVNTAESDSNSLISRYQTLVAAREVLNSRRSALEQFRQQIESGFSPLPNTAAAIAVNNTNSSALTTNEGLLTSYTNRIGAIQPGATHLAFNSSWNRFSNFSPVSGQCVGTDGSGNFISVNAPKSNGYPEIAVVTQQMAGDGGSITANTWTTRPLTNLSNSGVGWVSLVGGNLQLMPGFYVLWYSGVTNGVDGAMTQLVNQATGTVLRSGASVNGITGSSDANSFNTTHLLYAILRFTVPTTILIQVKCMTTNGFNANFTLGRGGLGSNIYQFLQILRMEGR